MQVHDSDVVCWKCRLTMPAQPASPLSPGA
jgi:hypothetical protein